MIDPYQIGSATNAAVITPSDTEELNPKPVALYVGEAGSLTVEMSGGGEVTFENVFGVLQVSVKKVLVDGTTAGDIVGLW